MQDDLLTKAQDELRANPLLAAAVATGAVAAIGYGAYRARQRRIGRIDERIDPLIDEEIQAGAVAY